MGCSKKKEKKYTRHDRYEQHRSNKHPTLLCAPLTSMALVALKKQSNNNIFSAKTNTATGFTRCKGNTSTVQLMQSEVSALCSQILSKRLETSSPHLCTPQQQQYQAVHITYHFSNQRPLPRSYTSRSHK